MSRKHKARRYVQPTRAELAQRVERTSVEVLRVTQYLRAEAAKPFECFDGRQKVARQVPGLDRTAISRALNEDGSNPLYRTALMLVAAWVGGLPRADAERIANWPQHVVDLLYPAEQVCLTEAMQREQYADADEDVRQVDYLTDPNPEHLEAWKCAAERYRAELDVALVAVNRRLIELRPQLAGAA